MEIVILTIFPDLCRQGLGHGLLARALAEARVSVRTVDLRDYADDPHRTVDDAPFGGGPGMVMKPEPLVAAIEAVPAAAGTREVVLLTPQGERLTQRLVDTLATRDQLLLVCGRYEGVDERVRQGWITREVSVGDYVLMGGELPALLLVEAVARKLQGIIGNPASLREESFSADWITPAEFAKLAGVSEATAAELVARGVIEYPHYTRPREFRGREVPAVLLTGNHREIDRWRRQEAVWRTLRRQQGGNRPAGAAGATESAVTN